MADNTTNDAVDIIIKGVKKIVDNAINRAPFTRTVACRIKQVQGNNEYIVTRNNNDYTAKSYFKYSDGDIVQVCLPQGKWKDAVIVYPQNVGEIQTLTSAVNTLNNNLANNFNCKVYAYTLVRTATSSWVTGLGTTNLVFNLDISDLGISSKPTVAFMQMQTQYGYQTVYNWDASTSNELIFQVNLTDASQLGENYTFRLGLVLFI